MAVAIFTASGNIFMGDKEGEEVNGDGNNIKI